MVGLARTVVSRAVAWLALAPGGLAAVQGAGEPMRGTVVDDRGEAVPRAFVRVEWDAGRSGFGGACAALAAPVRLPQTRTARDGTFALLATELQRALLRPELGDGWLVVTAPGHATWREPLGDGLRGYRGSAVVLPRARAEDTVTVDLAPFGQGALLLGRRIGDGRSVESARAGGDGRASLVLPLAPNPVLLGSARRVRGLGREWAVWAPGRSVGWVRDPGALRAPEPAAETLAVRRADGAALEGCRGLYRDPDGALHWFPLEPGDGGRVPAADGALRLVLLAAGGCVPRRVRAGAAEVVLAPRAAEGGAVTAAGADGEPLAEAEAWVWAAADCLSADGYEPRPDAAPVRVVRTGGGRLELGGVPGEHVVEVRAPGHLPRFELAAALGERVALEPAAVTEVALRVAGADGEPLASAWAVVAGGGGAPGRRVARWAAGADGVVRVADLPAERSFAVLCGAPGHVPVAWRADGAAAALTARVELQLVPAFDLAATTVGDDGSPVPFAPVLLVTRGGPVRVSELRSDSRGELRVGALARGLTHTVGPRRELDLDPGRATSGTVVHGAARGLEIAVPRDPHVLLRLPAAGEGAWCLPAAGVEHVQPLGWAQALLVRWDAQQEAVLWGGVDGRAFGWRPSGPLRWPLHEALTATRRLALAVEAPFALDAADLRVRLATGADALMCDARLGCPVEDGAVVMPAVDGVHLAVLHPRCVPLVVAAGTDRLGGVLERGTALEVSVPAPAADTDAELLLLARAGRRTVLRVSERVRVAGGGERARVDLPFALAPGRYEMSVLLMAGGDVIGKLAEPRVDLAAVERVTIELGR